MKRNMPGIEIQKSEVFATCDLKKIKSMRYFQRVERLNDKYQCTPWRAAFYSAGEELWLITMLPVLEKARERH